MLPKTTISTATKKPSGKPSQRTIQSAAPNKKPILRTQTRLSQMVRPTMIKKRLKKASDFTKLYKKRVNNYRYIQIDSAELARKLAPFAKPDEMAGGLTHRRRGTFVEELERGHEGKNLIKWIKVVLKELIFM